MRPTDFLNRGERVVDRRLWFLSPYENCDYYSTEERPKDLVWNCENRYFCDPIRINTVTYFQALLGTQADLHTQWNPRTSASHAREYQGII
jgi:hypothetical protein